MQDLQDKLCIFNIVAHVLSLLHEPPMSKYAKRHRRFHCIFYDIWGWHSYWNDQQVCKNSLPWIWASTRDSFKSTGFSVNPSHSNFKWTWPFFTFSRSNHKSIVFSRLTTLKSTEHLQMQITLIVNLFIKYYTIFTHASNHYKIKPCLNIIVNFRNKVNKIKKIYIYGRWNTNFVRYLVWKTCNNS